MKLIDGHGAEIRDWRNWEPPEKVNHWASGRSAMELARAWFTTSEPQVPPEIRALLDSHDLTRGLNLLSGTVEKMTTLPPGAHRKKRQHDLALVGLVGERRVSVCIEAKADEPFGEETIGSYYAAKMNERSDVPGRIKSLLEIAFGTAAAPEEEPYSDLMYQLLTAFVGTALEAKEETAAPAVFVVHEFHTDQVKIETLRDNARALEQFVRLLPGLSGVEIGRRLVGPVPVRHSEHLPAGVQVLVGKAVSCHFGGRAAGRRCEVCSKTQPR